LALVYILFGTDDFSLRQELEEIKSSLGDKESLALNTTVLDGRRLTAPQLINTCSTVPFLANCRLVIVEGLLERFDQSAATKRAELSEWQTFVDFVPAKPPTTILVLVDGKIAKSNPLLRKLAKIAKVQEFPALKRDGLQHWVQARVAGRAATISPRAARLLTETAGEDLWVLANEIEKLSLYAKGRQIEEEDVRRVTSSAREASIFAMVDAIAEKRLPAAMRLLHQLLTEGTPPTHLLTMMSRQVRLMVQAKELSRQTRLSSDEKRVQLGVSWNYPVDKLLSQSADHSKERLFAIYEKILDTDLAIKTGKWPDELALDLLVADVCS
jgi:DNA polymerase-3 subunit delta